MKKHTRDARTYKEKPNTEVGDEVALASELSSICAVNVVGYGRTT